jgi:hypothetical protein
MQEAQRSFVVVSSCSRSALEKAAFIRFWFAVIPGRGRAAAVVTGLSTEKRTNDAAREREGVKENGAVPWEVVGSYAVTLLRLGARCRCRVPETVQLLCL